MKRLAHPEIKTIFEFQEGVVNTLVIESQSFFRKIVTDIHAQTIGNKGDFVLSEDYSPVDISKNVELITQFVPFEINRKSLIGKVCASAEAAALNELNYQKTQELISNIERYFDGLLLDCPFQFEYSKLNIANLLRSVGISVSENYDNDIAKILDYLQLSREFERDKIYIFVNFRSYFTDDDLDLFMKEICSKKFNLLLIDNIEYGRFSAEKRAIIDKDLCEIL